MGCRGVVGRAALRAGRQGGPVVGRRGPQVVAAVTAQVHSEPQERPAAAADEQHGAGERPGAGEEGEEPAGEGDTTLMAYQPEANPLFRVPRDRPIRAL